MEAAVIPSPVASRPVRTGPERVNIVSLDVPFVTLTLFFIKASFAAALATIVTSVIWIAIWVAMGMVSMTLLAMLGVAGSQM